jgi:putative SOS response-associated peptidase YedK
VRCEGGSERKSRVEGKVSVFDLNRDRRKVWLADSPLKELEAMLEPVKVGSLNFYTVGTRVGSVTNDDEGLLKKLLRDDGDDLPFFPS